MKYCSKCDKFHPKSALYFGVENKKKDGLRTICRACTLAAKKASYLEKKDKILLKKREYYAKNKEKVYEACKRYVRDNKDKVSSKRKEYYKKNKTQWRAYIKVYVRNRKKTDPKFLIKTRMRFLIWNAMRRIGEGKKKGTINIIGCSSDFLKTHIEQQFLQGMTWENRSEWHIDHIIPLATAKNEEDVIRLNHYTNLRPLWAIDNLKKGARLDWTPAR